MPHSLRWSAAVAAVHKMFNDFNVRRFVRRFVRRLWRFQKNSVKSMCGGSAAVAVVKPPYTPIASRTPSGWCAGLIIREKLRPELLHPDARRPWRLRSPRSGEAPCPRGILPTAPEIGWRRCGPTWEPRWGRWWHSMSCRRKCRAGMRHERHDNESARPRAMDAAACHTRSVGRRGSGTDRLPGLADCTPETHRQAIIPG
jgi:hypothetical protein